MKILAVNPGSTSTKIAVYEDETPRLVLNIRHSVEELSPDSSRQYRHHSSVDNAAS